MTMPSVSVRLPRSVFLKLERAAELTHRSVEDILVSTVNAALVEPPSLPSDLASELGSDVFFQRRGTVGGDACFFVPG